MLILARKVDQVIHIYVNEGLIKLTVTGVDPVTGKVRLGFQAPESVDIIREEIDNIVSA